MIRRHPKVTGLIITTLLSMVVLSVFYGNLFGKLNRVCFASGGDGMQSYINMVYHIRYDTAYMHCNSMNYPYGEHVFFTNNQPLISNTVKFISRHIVDISDNMLGILNFIMLFCLVITPAILYLIFTGAGIGHVFSIVASVCITYLSPQLDRFGGHFNLSYVCAIPLMIYLLIRFFKTPTATLSTIIALAVLAGALTHFYLYGFFAVLILFFYLAYLSDYKSIFHNRYRFALHLFIQLILPFLILQAFYISDHVTDRTTYPWGFLVYRAYPQSVFLPLGRPYGRFLHSFIPTGYIDWEGYAYIGTLALAGFLFIGVKTFRDAFTARFSNMLRVTGNRHFNILFWASLVALLYSFGLPFILGLQSLVDLIGPVRQMRGIARFSWLFFYVMNIVTIYWLWEYYKNRTRKIFTIILVVVSLVVLCGDAWYNVRGRGRWLENHIPGLVDPGLQQPENQWIRHMDVNRYQAFIPLPYFHIGSENIWIDGRCGIVNQSFIAIKNSGLPCMGVMLSRTSLSQTINNISLMLGGSLASVDMKSFPNHKPFLLMAARCDELSAFEKELIRHARQVDSSGAFGIYEAPFSIFKDIADSTTKQMAIAFDSLPATSSGTFRMVGTNFFIFNGFDSQKHAVTFAGPGCYEGKAKDYNILFSSRISGIDTSKCLLASCWINKVGSDLYPRTRITLQEKDSLDNTLYTETWQLFKVLKQIENGWALVELPVTYRNPNNRLIISIQNTTLRNKPMQVDNLLLRYKTDTIYYTTGDTIWCNNRYYGRRPIDRTF
jgi:hypothetical protein